MLWSVLSPLDWATSEKVGKTAYLRPETLLGKHLGDALPEGVGVAWLGLDANLDGLHWSQSNVCKELGAGWRSQVQWCPPEVGVLLPQARSRAQGHAHAHTSCVFKTSFWTDLTAHPPGGVTSTVRGPSVPSPPPRSLLLTDQSNHHLPSNRLPDQCGSCSCTHLSQQVTVQDLENFIEPKLAESLHGVADEGGGPALGQASDAILLYCHGEAIADAFVLVRVHLRKRNTSKCQNSARMVLGVIIRTVYANIINISHNPVSAGWSTVCNSIFFFFFLNAIRGMDIFNFPLGLSIINHLFPSDFK